jgi:hypothetical protein
MHGRLHEQQAQVHTDDPCRATFLYQGELKDHHEQQAQVHTNDPDRATFLYQVQYKEQPFIYTFLRT